MQRKARREVATRLAMLLLLGVPGLALASSNVDGVLGFDGGAEAPIYMRAWELSPGTNVVGVKLYNNDDLATPSAVFVVQEDGKGKPDWQTAVRAAVPATAGSSTWVTCSIQELKVATTTRIWLAVQYKTGAWNLTEGRFGGPGIGYELVSAHGSVQQLVSSDGGVSYDRLDSRYILAIEPVFRASGLIQSTSGSSSAFLEAEETAEGLLDAQPNPFNPVTSIWYSVPVAGQVALEVYDIQGRRVVTLLRGVVSSGQHVVDWKGTDAAGAPVASGVYHIRLQVRDRQYTRKVTLMK